jgi:hypothetical protein
MTTVWRTTRIRGAAFYTRFPSIFPVFLLFFSLFFRLSRFCIRARRGASVLCLVFLHPVHDNDYADDRPTTDNVSSHTFGVLLYMGFIIYLDSFFSSSVTSHSSKHACII